jgi:hypothetical protein
MAMSAGSLGHAPSKKSKGKQSVRTNLRSDLNKDWLTQLQPICILPAKPLKYFTCQKKKEVAGHSLGNAKQNTKNVLPSCSVSFNYFYLAIFPVRRGLNDCRSYENLFVYLKVPLVVFESRTSKFLRSFYLSYLLPYPERRIGT